MLGGTRFLEACRRRYGNVVTFGTLFDKRFVMVFDPTLVKALFQGCNNQLHAGEANALLRCVSFWTGCSSAPCSMPPTPNPPKRSFGRSRWPRRAVGA